MCYDILGVRENFLIWLCLGDEVEKEILLVSGVKEELQPRSIVELAQESLSIFAEGKGATERVIRELRGPGVSKPTPESWLDETMEDRARVNFLHDLVKCVAPDGEFLVAVPHCDERDVTLR
jgi:hypothetical protein